MPLRGGETEICMDEYSIYGDIARRTGGDVYIGVVGPVRTGKSTFIKRFMESIVLPEMEDGPEKSRATDEMPQSGSGKNVMTTEPKFVPDQAVRIQMEGELGARIKLIDCVGFPIPGAGGLEEDGNTRMVNTPWSEEALPFEEAAALGTEKVIEEHSTVAVMITTDGSIGEISREAYLSAEEKTAMKLQKSAKPFLIVLNSAHPESAETQALAETLSEKYKAPVIPQNCFAMSREDLTYVLKMLVLEFPIREVKLNIPSWVLQLKESAFLKEEITDFLDEVFSKLKKTGEVLAALNELDKKENIESAQMICSDLGSGKISIEIRMKNRLFYEILSDCSGLSITCEEDLVHSFTSLAGLKSNYEKIADALREVEESGYGIVTPSIEDLKLEEPEIVKHPGGYGVKLKASAPSIHMIRANIQAEISPIVGSERQSEDMVRFLLEEFEEDPTKIWQSNMFGKSLYELVNEGLNTKLNHMPAEARAKLGETLQKIINEGSGGLICIIL
jgi:stage IV sporulation protein A